jgi:ABC-2 type transport system permease protein
VSPARFLAGAGITLEAAASDGAGLATSSRANWIGLWTLLWRETGRFLVLWKQTVLPPILSSVLYVLIFGYSLGSRIREIDGFPYTEFLLPGLAMMGIMNAAYSNSSSSLFMAKREYYLNDILIAPISYWEIVLAFMVGAMVRGILVGIVILGTGAVLAHLPWSHAFYAISIMLLVSALLSCVGLVIGLWAQTWDNIMLGVNFVITPLVFLGGVFYSIDMLPPFWKTLSHFNPLFYMINGMRYGVLGVEDASPGLSLALTAGLAAAAFALTVALFRSGYRLKS